MIYTNLVTNLVALATVLGAGVARFGDFAGLPEGYRPTMFSRPSPPVHVLVVEPVELLPVLSIDDFASNHTSSFFEMYSFCLGESFRELQKEGQSLITDIAIVKDLVLLNVTRFIHGSIFVSSLSWKAVKKTASILHMLPFRFCSSLSFQVFKTASFFLVRFYETWILLKIVLAMLVVFILSILFLFLYVRSFLRMLFRWLIMVIKAYAFGLVLVMLYSLFS
jgi:hypothetical protein